MSFSLVHCFRGDRGNRFAAQAVLKPLTAFPASLSEVELRSGISLRRRNLIYRSGITDFPSEINTLLVSSGNACDITRAFVKRRQAFGAVLSGSSSRNLCKRATAGAALERLPSVRTRMPLSLFLRQCAFSQFRWETIADTRFSIAVLARY